MEALLRQVLEQVGVEHSPSTTQDDSGSAEEVVLDLYLEGARYMLIRYPHYVPQPAVMLSAREQEIVRLIAKGFPNKAVATALDISLWTVATHLRRVFLKLGVNSRTEMIARVMKDGSLGREE